MLTTTHKILLARTAYRALSFARRLAGRGDEAVCERGGIRWKLDLREGIDFSIYLLGGFEPGTLRLYQRLVRPGDRVLDIGANIGSHTLPLARLAGAAGEVHAFEPTAFAVGKLRANLGLNPDLASRVVVHHCMLVASDADSPDASVYSSWPLQGGEAVHAQHHGRLMDTGTAAARTLDSVATECAWDRVDFIKLDVDGNEHKVLAGAGATLARFRPRLLVELAPYVYAAEPESFDAMLDGFWERGYRLRDVAGGAELPRSAAGVRARIPQGAGMNILAEPA